MDIFSLFSKKLLTTAVLHGIVQIVQANTRYNVHIKTGKGSDINMFKLDYSDGKPIYEQIKDNFKQLIIEGVLKTDDRIPSVRELAISMAINPNTIQKAYKELEFEGYVYSVRAKGVFVASIDNIVQEKNIDKLYKNLEDAVRELYFVGEDKEKLVDTISKIYERGSLT